MLRSTSRLAVLAATAALTTGLLSVPGAAALADAGAGRWHAVARLPRGAFAAVAAPGRADAWAFGTQQSSAAGPTYAVERHWNGRRWSTARRIVSRKNSYVLCAGASSTRNVWAFTDAGGGRGNPPDRASALRLRNGRWITEKVWSSARGTFISGCNVLNPADVWVFGGEIAGDSAAVGTWHLTRAGWRQPNTGHLVLFDASVVSARDLWAAGADISTVPAQPALGRWNGHAWKEDLSIRAVLPKTTPTRWAVIDAVKALSDRDVWVKAAISDHFQLAGIVVAHWNGTRWSRVKPGSKGYYLPTAVPDGQGGWWSAPYETANGGAPRYLLHEANGRWTKFPLPGPLYSVTGSLLHVPRSRAMLAVGLYHQATGILLAFGALPS